MMRRIWNYTVSGAIGGLFTGFWLAMLFSKLNGLNRLFPSSPAFISHFDSELTATAVAGGMWMAMGIVFSLSSLIFGVERWSITKKTVLHFIVTYVLFSTLAVVSQWFPFNFAYFANFTIIFIIIYVVMWMIEMRKARQTIAEINQKLAKK
ncbi:DUF3021 domain-containing protein [Fructilactobacillus cliffordii]|uniref:DUF3021 domain-containing protein n=1 Tax=Fructilactobacillus cliffordii TaxID=2940299 RepID=A0A9Q9E3T6_9LACO|nr:DUF3021 domain-containing protein [Fructilactobacillus cliffordii]USS89858.1 DUF3021 domain-containing protein [Fructilactobacillus cliffordii]